MIQIRHCVTDEILLTVDADTLRGANLARANLERANLEGAHLADANLEGAKFARPANAPPAAELRRLVADQLSTHPELHDQVEWGEGEADPHCGTPCCVAGWACHLGGGSGNLSVPTAATLLLWEDGKPMPSFAPTAEREEILSALRA